MGRWAQQQRRGGGPGTNDSGCIAIIDAVQIDDNKVTVSFSAPVTDGDFDPSDFHATPADATGTTVTNFTATQLDVEFDDILGTPQTLEYSGSAPGVCTPQTFPIHT